MKTPLLALFLVSLSIISLIVLASYMAENNSCDTSLDNLNFILLQRENKTAQNYSIYEKEGTESGYKLTYGWEDYEKNTHNITFSILKQQLLDAESEFGYYPDELEKHMSEHLEKKQGEMISYLEKFISQRLLRSKYSQYFFMDNVSPKDFKLKLSAPPSIYKKAKAEFDRIKNELTREQTTYQKKIEKDQKKRKEAFLNKRGFRFFGDKIGVNYSLCIQNNRARVKQVVEAMRSESKKKSLRQFLALMLAFIQEVRYGLPPIQENNKVILEFWVPPKVLVYNIGDCDSKGVTFASMWINFKRYPLLLIKVPKHLFVGLAIPSIGGEGFTINGLRYTLCEVTGPGKIPPGLITRYSQFYLEGRQFRYELIK